MDPTSLTHLPTGSLGLLDWTPARTRGFAPLRRQQPGAKIRHRLPVPDDVSDEIRRNHLHAGALAANTHPLDAYRMLLCLKIVVLLGIPDDRLEVADDDQGASPAPSRPPAPTSAATSRMFSLRRRAAIARDAQVACHVRIARSRRRIAACVTGALASAATSVARKVHEHDGATRDEHFSPRAIAGKQPPVSAVIVDDVIAIAEPSRFGYIGADDGGTAWRLIKEDPVTSVKSVRSERRGIRLRTLPPLIGDSGRA